MDDAENVFSPLASEELVSFVDLWEGQRYLWVLLAFSSRGKIWENVRQFTPRLRFFFVFCLMEISSRKLRLARAN